MRAKPAIIFEAYHHLASAACDAGRRCIRAVATAHWSEGPRWRDTNRTL